MGKCRFRGWLGQGVWTPPPTPPLKIQISKILKFKKYPAVCFWPLLANLNIPNSDSSRSPPEKFPGSVHDGKNKEACNINSAVKIWVLENDCKSFNEELGIMNFH